MASGPTPDRPPTGLASAGGVEGRSALGQEEAPAPLFGVASAPRITSISHDALNVWLERRAEYEGTIKTRCVTTGESSNALIMTIRNSFDESLLEKLCEVRWGTLKDELTDDFLRDEIKRITGAFTNGTLPNVDEQFRKDLRIDLSTADIPARVTNYFHLANAIIKRNGLSNLFAGQDGQPKKCKILLDCLPMCLKRVVQNELIYRREEARTSVMKLHELVTEHALERVKEDRAIAAHSTKPPRAHQPSRSEVKHSGTKTRLQGYKVESQSASQARPGVQ